MNAFVKARSNSKSATDAVGHYSSLNPRFIRGIPLAEKLRDAVAMNPQPMRGANGLLGHDNTPFTNSW